MIEVTVVERLVTRKAMKASPKDWIQYFQRGEPIAHIRGSDEGLIGLDYDVAKEIYVPIIRLCETGKPDVYVAFSEEVEKLLGIPVRAIEDRAARAERDLNVCQQQYNFVMTQRRRYASSLVQVAGWNLWNRLKFVVGLLKVPEV